MTHSTVRTASAAMAGSDEFKDFLTGLLPRLLTLFAGLQAFRQQPPTPERTCAFETATAAIPRESGRVLVEHEYNRIEPACLDDCPFRLRFAGAEYRRRPKSPNQVGTLFGAVEPRRYWYEAVEAGEPALFPLEQHLGIEAGLATPALAERVGLWSVDHEQEQVRSLPRREHNASWSVTSVRQVTRALRDGLASFREEARVARVLALLTKAVASQGKHRPAPRRVAMASTCRFASRAATRGPRPRCRCMTGVANGWAQSTWGRCLKRARGRCRRNGRRTRC